VGLAFAYAVGCTLLGAVPLSLLLAALLMTVADPLILGMRSTGVLSNAVSSVLAAVALATLLPLLLFAWAFWVFAVARLLLVSVRFELLVRAAVYGFSLTAVPLFGPLLLPLAFVCALSCMQALVATEAAPLRATGIVLLGSLLVLSPLVLLLV
jgi:hypothetical protein